MFCMKCYAVFLLFILLVPVTPNYIHINLEQALVQTMLQFTFLQYNVIDKGVIVTFMEGEEKANPDIFYEKVSYYEGDAEFGDVFEYYQYDIFRIDKYTFLLRMYIT